MNDGGCAFPIVTDTEVHPGISMRDWFAGMALQGMLCNGFVPDSAASDWDYAASAYKLADAMLKERVK